MNIGKLTSENEGIYILGEREREEYHSLLLELEYH